MTARVTLCGYERISHDPTGAQAGVERQHRDIEHLAAIFDADVCWHRDNDQSAFLDDVVRDHFEEMLVHVGHPGHPSRGVLAYDLDRLCRRGDDLQRLLKLYKRDETLIFRTSAQEINLSAPDGRLMAEVMVAFAQKESADKQRRQRRLHYYRALTGKPTGPHGFGHLPNRIDLDPIEAPVIRAAGEDVLTGTRSTAQVARDWNQAGYAPRPRRRKLEDGSFTEPKSGKWSSRTVTQLLRAPRIGGYAVYQKEIARDAEGGLVRSTGLPIMDPEKWLKLQAFLLSEERGAGVDTRSASHGYLASGTLRCGGCRNRLNGHGSNRTGVHRYECQAREGRGCGQCSIDGPSLDRMLDAYVEGALSMVDPAQVGIAVEPWGREEEMAEVAARHAEAFAAYTSGSSPLSRQTQVAALEALEERLETLRREQRKHRGREVEAAAMADAGDLAQWRKAFAEGNWTYCRFVVSTLIATVTVSPAPPGKRGKAGAPRWFDPNRVEIVPRKPS